MRIAVLHHTCRGDAVADAAALAESARFACGRGAEVIIAPRIPSLVALPTEERDALLSSVGGCIQGATLIISFAADDAGRGRILETSLGRTALVAGDACLAPETAEWLKGEQLDAVIWRPGAESEIQAEAIVEYALGCAPLLAGLLVLVECSGAPEYEAHEGTSAIIHLGELVAESAGEGDEALVVNLEVPLEAPERGLPLPQPSPLLAQRIAAHNGRKVAVDYPADLS